ncbi:diacylglycerol/lipid kinase family protein [Nocardia higoensis]|uniref:diacylglycerol/lipid kinase family protein n=1 Tax=Nocardia higoensis TaxID=228599 RepID=UPI0002EBB32E|nr:diacylglycerol kinase family protein [Nocardia higoensis]
MTTDDYDRAASATRMWSARLAFALTAAAALTPILGAGLRGALGLVGVGACAVVLVVAALYRALITRGALRWLSLCVAIVAPVLAVALFVRAQLLWVVLLTSVLVPAAVACARVALRPDPKEAGMPEYPAPPPRRPFLIMNPHSGGGKVGKFDLRRRAEALGAEVVLLEGPGTVDVEAVARAAAARGADLLGVAGGDGTQALVAGVAAEHGLPFLVISAGTRNHFAMDLGLDRADPAASLAALTDGVELRIDLARINGRPFVNNASFGIYAEIVKDPAYRDDKTATVLEQLPDLLTGHRGARLSADIDGSRIVAPQAILVSNNPYGTSDLAGLSRRDRLDRGVLGIVTVSVTGTAAAVGLLHRTRTRGLTQRTATAVTIDADHSRIPVGVDGESLLLDTPVRCVIEPGALRVRLPRNRPARRASAPAVDWVRLRRLAFG